MVAFVAIIEKMEMLIRQMNEPKYSIVRLILYALNRRISYNSIVDHDYGIYMKIDLSIFDHDYGI